MKNEIVHQCNAQYVDAFDLFFLGESRVLKCLRKVREILVFILVVLTCV